MRPDQLVVGHCYFDITYPDATLTKPIIATYEYVGEDELESDQGEGEQHFLFKFHPKYKSEDPDAIENGLIAYTIEQLKSLIDIAELRAELKTIHEKLNNKKHS
ncbi:MAG TPA: hypothetical protein VGA00_04495 [Acidiferrobacterales bacterium]